MVTLMVIKYEVIFNSPVLVGMCVQTFRATVKIAHVDIR